MTNNLFRSTIALTIAIYTLGYTIDTANGNDFCTLEGMREHAADACDILLRHIRSADDDLFDLPYHIVDSNDLGESESRLTYSHGNHHHHQHSRHGKSRVHIRKHEFPNDGYLLVDQQLSKYLVRKNRNVDTFSYNTVNGNVDSNDDGVVISFVDIENKSHHNHHHSHRRRVVEGNDDDVVINYINYDSNEHPKHHSHRHRAQQHPRFRRQQDKTNVQYCCRYPDSDVCRISMC